MLDNCRSLSYNCTLRRHRNYAPEMLEIRVEQSDEWFSNVGRHQPELAQICRNRKHITHFQLTLAITYTLQEEVLRAVKMAMCFHTLEVDGTGPFNPYLDRPVSGVTHTTFVSCIQRCIRCVARCRQLCHKVILV